MITERIVTSQSFRFGHLHSCQFSWRVSAALFNLPTWSKSSKSLRQQLIESCPFLRMILRFNWIERAKLDWLLLPRYPWATNLRVVVMRFVFHLCFWLSTSWETISRSQCTKVCSYLVHRYELRRQFALLYCQETDIDHHSKGQKRRLQLTKYQPSRCVLSFKNY